MPAPLALLLCSVFVLGLLWVERRQSRDASVTSWIPTVYLLLVSSKPLAIWFGLPGDNETGSVLDRLVLAALALAGVAVLGWRGGRWTGALRGSGWLLALLAYMLVSTFWSDIPAIALKRWVRQAIVVIMALMVASERNPLQALASVLRRSAYVLIPFSIVLIKYYPGLGVDYASWSGLKMWVGVTLHKNSLSSVCTASVFFLLWATYRRWRDGLPVFRNLPGAADVAVLLLGLHLLKGAENAYSATSLVMFALGLSGLAGLHWLRRQNTTVPLLALLALLCFVIGYGVAAPFLGGSNVAAFSSALGRDATLTGRTETWAQLVPVAMSQPLLGSGFGSFWTTDRREFYRMSNGHNGYLDTILDLGFAGLAIYAAWLISCAWHFHRGLAKDYDWATLGICFVLMAAVQSIAESSFSSLTAILLAVIIAASFSTAVTSAAGDAPATRHTNRRVLRSRPARPVSSRGPSPKGLDNESTAGPVRSGSRRRPTPERSPGRPPLSAKDRA